MKPVINLFATALLVACGDPCDESGTICTVVGTGVAQLSPEGTCAEEAATYSIIDLTIGPDGQPYYLDWNNHRVVTVEPGTGGECDTIHTVTGTANLGDGPEGSASAASWNHPTNLVFEDEDTFLMAAWHNSRVVRVDIAGDSCDFIAGTSKRDFGGDGGPATEALLDLPAGVELDGEGNIYVADQANQRVRRIDSDGIIDTVVGTGEYGFSGDGGPALDATLANELSQAAAPSGKLVIDGRKMYIADTDNHRVRVVDLDTWIIDTFAGNGSAGFAGDGGEATEASLNAPRDVEVGPDGAVYIADTANHCVRVVRDGRITTAAGVCGTSGYEGDRRPANEALLNTPFGIESGPDGALWIADTSNHALRRVTP